MGTDRSVRNKKEKLETTNKPKNRTRRASHANGEKEEVSGFTQKRGSKRPNRLKSRQVCNDREEASEYNLKEQEEPTGTGLSAVYKDSDETSGMKKSGSKDDQSKLKRTKSKRRLSKKSRPDLSVRKGGQTSQKGALGEMLSARMKKMKISSAEESKRRQLPEESKTKSYASKLKARGPKKEQQVSQKQSKHGETVFVTKKSRKLIKDIYPYLDEKTCADVGGKRDDFFDFLSPSRQEQSSSGGQETSLVPLSISKDNIEPIKNFDNNGVIFVGDRPFWFIPASKPTDEELEALEDSPEMNATTIIEYSENKLAPLLVMPSLESEPDPYADVEIMKKKDKSCFSIMVVFGNTVRSMINLNREYDMTGEIDQWNNNQGNEKKVVVVTEPEVVWFYSRKTQKKLYNQKFEHREKPADMP